MREASEKEFAAVLNSNRWEVRRMSAGRCFDAYYTDCCGVEIASKHEVTKRGKVAQTSYMINPDRLPEGFQCDSQSS